MTHHDDSGFSLIETIVAMGILATGLLGLAGVFTLGMAHMATSSANLIAREKAREAVESVHTARDTRTIQWAQIRNVSAGGVFLNGAKQIHKPGLDGLVNTADDDTAVEELRQPGPDGILGNADDVHIPLTNYTRDIVISDLFDQNNNLNQALRQITVTIRYTVGPVTRTYTLTTYISSIS
jgi:prepilin-type N-terminal cleavage/methylation domain-containing protein